MQKYYITSEVAEILQVNEFTVLRWIRAKKLSAVDIGGRYRVSEEALKEFIEQRTKH